MIRIRVGKVLKVLQTSKDLIELMVQVEGKEEKALAYPQITGAVNVADSVLLNTTAMYKKLGTGGNHFVMANLNIKETNVVEKGHIMKLRYTPQQVKVLAVEEEDSPYAEVMKNTTNLNNMIVVAATLHSMLPPIVAALHTLSKGKLRVAYLMTDGAALPIALSKMVRNLKEKGLIHATITCGHSFGGDYEAINVYSGLLAAKAVVKADITVVAMGPGIVGTGSKYGYTGLEQGQVINAIHTLGGRGIAVPRISFADPRERHHGLSHHTRTALGNVALAPCTVALPQMEAEKEELVNKQLEESGIAAKHKLVQVDAASSLQALQSYGIKVTTMGRGVKEDREFFLAAGAAGLVAWNLFSK